VSVFFFLLSLFRFFCLVIRRSRERRKAACVVLIRRSAIMTFLYSQCWNKPQRSTTTKNCAIEFHHLFKPCLSLT
jgi:hypothetical protein